MNFFGLVIRREFNVVQLSYDSANIVFVVRPFANKLGLWLNGRALANWIHSIEGPCSVIVVRRGHDTHRHLLANDVILAPTNCVLHRLLTCLRGTVPHDGDFR